MTPIRFAAQVRGALYAALVAAALGGPGPATAQESAHTRVSERERPARRVRVTGIVRDELNGIALPGIPIQLVGTETVVYTDVDGRFVLDVPPGRHQLTVTMDGYEEKTISVSAADARTLTADVGLAMTRYAETVTVIGDTIDADASSAEAQLIERKQAQVITDNMGAQEMKANGDSDAAAAMSRITGLSVVDNQYVFVRGLGERYSNTTLSGSLIPTTEPDRKVVPLDLFPAGLISSVQVNKSYSPDRPAEFAGGLVQIVPLKLPAAPMVDFSYGMSLTTAATGKSIPLSPLGTRDWLGFDSGARTLPASFPSNKIVRRGIYTPDVGYTADEITGFARLLDNRWRPAAATGRPGQNWSVVLGNRFDRLGVVASATHSYKEHYVEEQRRFFRIADGSELEAVSDYAIRTGTQKAQLGIVANIAYQFTSNHRLSLENFYTHSGRDEGRTFEGPNTENQRLYRNARLQFVEEGLMANAFAGEHFFQRLSNSRVDWRASYARATRDEPDLRETLYEAPLNGGTFVLADESQSGFRMYNELGDDTTDVAANWSLFSTAGGRPTQVKAGVSYVERAREFSSRRFRFIPIVTQSGGSVGVDLSLAPETLYTAGNIGRFFRFNEETRPVDAYDGEQTTTSAYGMVDLSFTDRTRVVAGARVERFDQVVNTFDPFGLFVRTISATNRNTDVFPAVNLVQALTPSMNLRLGYSTTVNRPEFRELAPFEFTDVVGSRAVRGNPSLSRALIQNVDARWELFTGGRGVLAASLFYKRFESPIERVVIAGAQPIVTFQNSDRARNYGFEFEGGREIVPGLFLSANYTYVDSTITLLPAQRTVQTSVERPLAGQSTHLFNGIAELSLGGFSTRLLYNFFGDRISDVGANEAPDIVEQGRGTVDLVFSQRLGRLGLRVTFENLTDAEHLFSQGAEDQRLFRLGRTIALALGFGLF